MPADKSAPNDNLAQAAQFAQAGIRAAKNGRNAEARKLLRQALDLNETDEQAWLWLAAAVESPGERRVCLENVLDINPENAVARRALARIVDETSATAKAKSTAPRPRPSTMKPRSSTGRAATSASSGTLWVVLVGIVIALALIGGWVIAVQPSLVAVATLTPTRHPSPTLDFISQQQTSDAESIATATALAVPYNPTSTPLPTLFAVIATWTPAPSPTLPPSLTPTATPLPLGILPLVFVGEGRGQKTSGLYTIKADGSNEQPLVQGDSALYDPALSPDGRQIAYVSTINNSPTLLVANADGSQARQVVQTAGKYLHSPAWSPDGTQIAYAATNTDTGHAALYVISKDGTGQRSLTDGQYECHDPAWSPDGSQIVYAADLTNRGNFQLYRLDPRPIATATDATNQAIQDTPAPPTPLTVSSNSNYGPAWSPDGRQIAFVSTRDGHAALYVMAVDGSDQKPLEFAVTTAESREPAWSPDGRWIAFSSNRENGVFAIYVISVDNRQVRRLTDLNYGSAQPRFYPGR